MKDMELEADAKPWGQLCWVILEKHWDLWEPVRAKTIGDDLQFVIKCVLLVRVVNELLLLSSRGSHLLT